MIGQRKVEIALLFSKKRRVVNTNGRFGKIFPDPLSIVTSLSP